MAELSDVEAPAWPLIQAEIAASERPVSVFPVARRAGEICLEQLQVTTRSALGALALNCGGLLVDRGWLRILGGGAPGLPSLAAVNGIDDSSTPRPGFMVVAIDVLGGRFAINGGALPGDPGKVSYFAPDSLTWEPLDLGHGALVSWALSDEVDTFYETARWSTWEDDIDEVRLDQAIQSYPPPFTKEGQPPNPVTRRTVGWTEASEFLQSAAAQLG